MSNYAGGYRFVFLTIALLIGGCESLPAEPTPIEAGDSLIRFEHEDFQPELSDYAVQRDPRTGNQSYMAAFYGSDTHGLVLAWKSAPGYVVNEMRTETLIERLLAEAELVWRDSGGTNSALGHVRYRLFGMVDQPVTCVGFSQSRGETADDSNRKSGLIYGFFCRDESRPLTPEAASDLIARVSLGG